MPLRLAPHVTVTDTDGGAVLLDERAGRYWQVNASGAAVLHHLAENGDVDAAVARLRDRFPDAADRVEGDVRDLLDALLEAGLVTR